MIKVHVDGIIFSLQMHGGISVYTKSLINIEKDINIILSLEDPYFKHEELENITPIIFKRRKLERFRSCRFIDADIFHSSYYRISENKNIKSVLTVHDLIYEKYAKGLSKYLHIIQKKIALKNCHKIICVSETTKMDLINFYKIPEEKIKIIPNGVSSTYKLIESSVGIDDYILYVGSRSYYKNFDIVLKSLKLIKELNLYIVGGGALTKQEIILINETIGFNRLKTFDFLNEINLNILYNNSKALIYPSSYEGFGIPILEAFRTYCPVIIGNNNALLEFGSENLFVCQSGSSYEYAEIINNVRSIDKLQNCKTTSAYQKSLSYSWDKTSCMTKDLYLSII